MNPTNKSFSLPEYRVPEWDDYECQSTGRCCHGWIVTVDDEHRENIESALADHPHPEWGDTMPIDEEHGEVQSLRVDNGQCPYLTENGLCWLHREFGAETKPKTCRTYPEETIKTPLGIFKNIRISCVTATRMLASSSYSIEPDTTPIPDDTGDVDPFQFSRDTEISPRTYLNLENAVLTILSRDQGTIEHRLGAVGPFLRTASEELGENEADGRSMERVVKGFLNKSLPTIDADAKQHVRIINAIIEYREEFIGHLKQAGTHHEITQLIESLKSIFGFHGKPISTVAEQLQRDRQNKWEPTIDQHEPILEHYLKRKIWSKTLTYRYGLLDGLKILASLFAMIRLASLARATENDTNVERWQLLESIVTVERCFTHSGDNQFLWKEILGEADGYHDEFISCLSVL